MSQLILLLFLVKADFYTVHTITHYHKRDILPPKHVKIARPNKTKKRNVYTYIAIDRAVFTNECQNKPLPFAIRPFCACTAKTQINYNTLQYNWSSLVINKRIDELYNRDEINSHHQKKETYQLRMKQANELGVFIAIHSCRSFGLPLSI